MKKDEIIQKLEQEGVIVHSGGMMYVCSDGAIFPCDWEADTHCEMNGLDKYEDVYEEKDDYYFIANEHRNKLRWGLNGGLYRSYEIVRMYLTKKGIEKLLDKTDIKSRKEVAIETHNRMFAPIENPTECKCSKFDVDPYPNSVFRRRPNRGFYTLHNHNNYITKKG